ncbi:MAG: hypothetical protein HY758_08750 [Nitrospirae bacterium]|nr:hypothetical protein [Nitrospirota bacterium]
MNRRIFILLGMLLLVFVFAINIYAGGYRIKGNGFNYIGENGERGSMGVYAATPNDGWVRYYYPDMNLESTAISSVAVSGNTATITGQCKVQDTGGYIFKAVIIDSNPDSIGLEIFDMNGSRIFQSPQKEIEQGDFIISAQ